jgi:hypothetical protein
VVSTHGTDIVDLAFSPQGDYLATLDEAGVTKVWQVAIK